MQCNRTRVLESKVLTLWFLIPAIVVMTLTRNQIEPQSLQSIDLNIPSTPPSPSPPSKVDTTSTKQSNSPIHCHGEEVIPNDLVDISETDNSSCHSASSNNEETEKSSNGGGDDDVVTDVTPQVLDFQGKIIKSLRNT